MPKRTLQGVVVSDKQDKTVVVRVERRFTHPVMKKTVRRSKKYHAHDEKNEFSVGDIVWIEEHKPISKLKRWAVVRGEKRARPKRRSKSNARSARRRRRARQGRSGRRRQTELSARRRVRKKCEAPHDPDANQPRRGGQFRRAPRHVHQGAGRLQAQIRHHRRRHRRLGQGGDPARPRQEGRGDEGRGGAHPQGHQARRTAR